jgi:hypothetical protein
MAIKADKNKDNINLSLTFPCIRDRRRHSSMYIPEAYGQLKNQSCERGSSSYCRPQGFKDAAEIHSLKGKGFG